MPIFSFFCDDCDLEFEELLIKKAEIEEFTDHYPCPQCRERAERIRVASFAFQFAGGVKGESGVHGTSGSHDLDYPSLDKAVGRSSEKKWKNINARQEKRAKARKELGTNAITEVNGQVRAVDSKTLSDRQRGLEMFKRAKAETDGKK